MHTKLRCRRFKFRVVRKVVNITREEWGLGGVGGSYPEGWPGSASSRCPHIDRFTAANHPSGDVYLQLSKDVLFYQAKLGLRSSLIFNLETNGLKVTAEHHQWPGRWAACKDRIAQRSPIQAAATLDVA
ncbi:hypothetical protein J6590_051901 [Homalodisca vitripennis]|nr:hypothetical protein J6590_051901 [Homalodisca vitripennis]